MKRMLMILPLLTLAAACDPLQQSQLAGTVGGAAVGALVTPNYLTQGG